MGAIYASAEADVLTRSQLALNHILGDATSGMQYSNRPLDPHNALSKHLHAWEQSSTQDSVCLNTNETVGIITGIS